MAKTEETLIIEDVLYQNLFGSNPCLAREYGTKEVTVTLLKEKKVKQIVDFLSYNAKKMNFDAMRLKSAWPILRVRLPKHGLEIIIIWLFQESYI